MVEHPTGYGRIVRAAAGATATGQPIARIVEEKDASLAEREIREINSGIYAFALDGLLDALRGLRSDNAQKEYYLPDLVGAFRQRGLVVETAVQVANPDEILGINSRIEFLAAVSRIVETSRECRADGGWVTIEDARNNLRRSRCDGRMSTIVRRRPRQDEDRRALRDSQRRADRWHAESATTSPCWSLWPSRIAHRRRRRRSHISATASRSARRPATSSMKKTAFGAGR